MRFYNRILSPFLLGTLPLSLALPTSFSQTVLNGKDANVTFALFQELEEFSRIVDISYCVGTTGIHKPFRCASRCNEFLNFELVDTFNTGPLMSDSCGYIVLDHGTSFSKQAGRDDIVAGGRSDQGRIIVAFRGTYSIANTIVDLSTVPQEYIPYPDDSEGGDIPPPQSSPPSRNSYLDLIPPILRTSSSDAENSDSSSIWIPESPPSSQKDKCLNCTVHTGFWASWQNTRPIIVDYLTLLRYKYPTYKLHLVGHSLGGAVAALAGLEFQAYGWDPVVTTFGEPKIGNKGMKDFVDWRFGLRDDDSHADTRKYRRITHADDPVPLLPLREWGYESHAGEVFIQKAPLQPERKDLRLCAGDEDPDCISSGEENPEGSRLGDFLAKDDVKAWLRETKEKMGILSQATEEQEDGETEAEIELSKRWGMPVPARYKIWQLFFAHRDYFWRLGLCVPGGDPLNWGEDGYEFGQEEDAKVINEEL